MEASMSRPRARRRVRESPSTELSTARPRERRRVRGGARSTEPFGAAAAGTGGPLDGRLRCRGRGRGVACGSRLRPSFRPHGRGSGVACGSRPRPRLRRGDGGRGVGCGRGRSTEAPAARRRAARRLREWPPTPASTARPQEQRRGRKCRSKTPATRPRAQCRERECGSPEASAARPRAAVGVRRRPGPVARTRPTRAALRAPPRAWPAPRPRSAAARAASRPVRRSICLPPRARYSVREGAPPPRPCGPSRSAPCGSDGRCRHRWRAAAADRRVPGRCRSREPPSRSLGQHPRPDRACGALTG